MKTLKCIEKEVRLTHRHGKGRRGNVSVIREHYLRDDISCKVENCSIAICKQQGNKLNPEASHYAIPDVPALSDYLEVFEQPGVSGCILLQTALTHIRSKVGRQSYRRAKALLHSPLRRFVTFSNENHSETFSQREKEESREMWHQRLVYKAGVWYTNHLQVSAIQTPIVIITPHPEQYTRCESEKTKGLSVVSLENYLGCYWPALAEVQTLLLSLMESVNSSRDQEPVDTASISHWPPAKIKEELKKGVLYSGRLRVSQYHPRDEAFVTLQSVVGDGGQMAAGSEIFISGTAHRNRAIHSDLVAVRLLPRSQWRARTNALPLAEGQKAANSEGEVDSGCHTMATGQVVGILERADRHYVATFDESSDTHGAGGGRSERVLVFPYDSRIPKVRISTRQAQDLRNHRFVIHIDSWEAHSNYPNGHFVRVIGPIGDVETETQVVLTENELATASFNKALLRELPGSGDGKETWKVDESEITLKGRRDLRHTHLIMSIDPRGCEDVDDALSVRSLAGGDVELGVHIADVSHFVRPGSLTDLEARQRSTTVYMADRRYDMLPAILSADLCSLLSNVDRYAVSVMWRLDRSYHVKEVWFGRTVIRSRYKLAYEAAQAAHDGASAEELVEEISELQSLSLSLTDKRERVAELRSAIRSLVEIAHVLRDRRGGLELEGVEVRVQIDDKDKTKVEDLIPKQPLDMHEVIAECMIFANNWVAREIHKSYPSKALLRYHPGPAQDRFAQLVACARTRGFTMETQTNKQLAHSLDQAVDPNDPNFNRVLRYLATQAMVQAQYFSTGSVPPEKYGHYGLDLDLYTHFTSPIRRYADLVVHRQLLAAVGDQSTDPDLLPSNSQLDAMAQHMNKKRRAAQLAQIASTELFQGLYFSSADGSEEGGGAKADRHKIDTVVIGIRSNGLLVFSLRYGIRGPVYLRDKQGLVAQPDHTLSSSPSSSEHRVVFDSGTLEQTDQSITVSYPGGQYTFKILDHVRVHVTSMASHAHGMSLRLQLLQCGPAPPPRPLAQKHDATKEIVRTIQAQDRAVKEQSGSTRKEFQQSDTTKSLYCTIQRLQKLALQPA